MLDDIFTSFVLGGAAGYSRWFFDIFIIGIILVVGTVLIVLCH